MDSYDTADSLHRLMKQAIDSGQAKSLEEAEALFRGYRLQFVIDGGEAQEHQAALLTGIALARRVFLGGVEVSGDLNAPLRVPLPLGSTLAEAVARVGGGTSGDANPAIPTIYIGGPVRPRSASFQVRTVFAGWRGGVMPAHAPFNGGEAFTVALAPMLAAALAVNEAFFHVQGKTPTAGRRAAGFSLWALDNPSWLNPEEDAPAVQYLPSHLWLIGLGHLGQAYLWALGLLPYPAQGGVSLILHDIDVITTSTFSTSILTEPEREGRKKTREMAAWCEARGFDTTITERKFDGFCKRAPDEPVVALCGLDNALGRQALEEAGFHLIVEAGLGRGHRDFRTMRLHTLPGSRPAAEIWKTSAHADDVTGQQAYQELLSKGVLDQCGVTLLAGKAVGAPFVGAIAACLAIAEVLRLLHGGTLHELIDLDLASPDHRYLVKQTCDFSDLNPGFVYAYLE